MWDSVLKAVRAGVVVVLHSVIATVLVLCAAVVEGAIHLVNDGRDPLLFGVLHFSYLFQAIDVGMLGVFGFYGLKEAARIMRE